MGVHGGAQWGTCRVASSRGGSALRCAGLSASSGLSSKMKLRPAKTPGWSTRRLRLVNPAVRLVRVVRRRPSGRDLLQPQASGL